MLFLFQGSVSFIMGVELIISSSSEKRAPFNPKPDHHLNLFPPTSGIRAAASASVLPKGSCPMSTSRLPVVAQVVKGEGVTD